MKNTATATTVQFNYYTLNAKGKTCPKCGGLNKVGYDWNMKTGAAQARCQDPRCNHSYDPTTRQPLAR